MKRALFVLLLAVLAGCQSAGNTAGAAAEGVTLRLSVFGPATLAEGAEGAVDVIVANRGVGTAGNVLVDVTLPPEMTLVRETHGTGVSVLRDPHLLRYTIGTLGVGGDTRMSVTVRGGGTVNVVAQEPAVGGDRLERSITVGAAK
jgi:hypothetical protein